MKKRVQTLFGAFGITMFAIVLLFIVDKLVLGQKEAETKINAYEEEHKISGNNCHEI